MLLHTVRWLWSEDQRMLFTVVMIRLRFNTFRSESPEGGTSEVEESLSPGLRSASSVLPLSGCGTIRNSTELLPFAYRFGLPRVRESRRSLHRDHSPPVRPNHGRPSATFPSSLTRKTLPSA